MLSIVMWSPSEEENFSLAFVAFSLSAVEFTRIESAERRATMQTISSLDGAKLMLSFLK